MNYNIFEEINDGKVFREENETEQQYMERVFERLCIKEPADGGVMFNDMMKPSLLSCDHENKKVSFKFEGEDWMLNPNGTIHGGIITTACDMTMGTLARFFFNGKKTVTVEINTEFLRPVFKDRTYVVEARIVKNGKNVTFTECKVKDAVSGEFLADASGIFM